MVAVLIKTPFCREENAQVFYPSSLCFGQILETDSPDVFLDKRDDFLDHKVTAPIG